MQVGSASRAAGSKQVQRLVPPAAGRARSQVPIAEAISPKDALKDVLLPDVGKAKKLLGKALRALKALKDLRVLKALMI